jgi:hypothetical protein
MTSVEGDVLPLMLPHRRLAEAAAALAEASALLRRAQEVEWVSALAVIYRAELEEALAQVQALAARVDAADDAIARLDTIAAGWGQ